MAAAIRGKFKRWIVDNLFWDTTGATRAGFWGGLWATRKLLVAVAGSALLTWLEWKKNHPPEILLVALIHFVFVLAAVALVILIGRLFSHGGKKPSGT